MQSSHHSTYHKVSLSSGTLHLNIDQALMPLQELVCFASRQNNRRAFLFVSKVLGKHYPVPPQKMRQIYCLLAEEISPLIQTGAGAVICLGMAETATGFSAGVYEELLKKGSRPFCYCHSTRYSAKNTKILHRFEEPHSHASSHFINAPPPAVERMLAEAETLVLLDDEQTTCTTACNAMVQLRRKMPKLRQVILACLTNWAGEERLREIEKTWPELSFSFPSLLAGTAYFEKMKDFRLADLPDAVGCQGDKSAFLALGSGRNWYCRPPSLHPAEYKAAKELLTGCRCGQMPVLVLGTGEFTYQPFLLAEQLAKDGFNIVFQSTTRSPILIEKENSCINLGLSFADNYGEKINNYLYNVDPSAYQTILICYETRYGGEQHILPDELDNIHKVFLPLSCQHAAAQDE